MKTHAKNAGPVEETRGQKVLIIDDDAASLGVISDYLRGSGFVALAARSGESGIEKARYVQPDIIFLDVLMPGINGFETCRRLKSEPATAEIPVIFMTALVEVEDKVKGFEAGAVDYVTKPFQSREILSRVRMQLKLSALTQELRHTNEELTTHRDRLEELVEDRTAEIKSVNLRMRAEIVERKQAEEALAKERNLLRALIDNLPDYIYVKDTQSRLLLANAAVVRSHKAKTLDEILGTMDFGFFPEEVAQQFYDGERKVFESGQPIVNREEYDIDLRTGVRKWMLTTKAPFRDSQGKIAGLVGLSRDITELKQAQEALQTLNAELERRVEERTLEYQAANQALKESLDTLRAAQDRLVQAEKMAALGGLVAGVAHELNTPVGIGVTAASYLDQNTREFTIRYQEDRMTRSDLEKYLKTTGESAKIILKNLQRAAEHIRSFKRVAVDQTSDEKRVFNLKIYIDDLLLSLRPRLKRTQHTVTIHCPENLDILSYPGAFSQILTNFIINSLTHGFENIEQGAILLEITREGDLLTICYRDNGRGISLAERSRVFEPFYTTKRGQGGTGLGLHIVYNLVTQKLGGSIECESTPGKGITFLIQIPVNGSQF